VTVTESVRIGESNSRHLQLAEPRHMIVQQDGSIVVAEASTSQIKSFDSRGALLWTFGRPGVEARSFGEILGVASAGDTIGVLDNANGLRLQLFQRKLGAAPQSIGAPIFLGPPAEGTQVLSFGRVGSTWCVLVQITDNRAVLTANPSAPVSTTLELLPLNIRTGQTSRAIWTWRDTIPSIAVRLRNSAVLLRPVFAPAAAYSFSGDMFHFARGLDSEIVIVGGSGSRRTVTAAMQRVPVDSNQRERFIAEQARIRRDRLAQGQDTARSRAWLTVALPILQQLKSPSLRPPVAGLWVSGDGSFAMGRADMDPNPWTAGDSVIVDIFAPTGEVRGRVSLPPESVIRAFTGKELFVQVVDRSNRTYEEPTSRRLIALSNIVRYALTF
jgi:hypothetical protein